MPSILHSQWNCGIINILANRFNFFFSNDYKLVSNYIIIKMKSANALHKLHISRLYPPFSLQNTLCTYSILNIDQAMVVI